MSWLSGIFTRTNGTYSGATVWNQDRLAGTKVTSANHDTHDQDIATGINACLNKNGENSPTANVDWGGFKITNLGAGAVSGDATNYTQLLAARLAVPTLKNATYTITSLDYALYKDDTVAYTWTLPSFALGGIPVGRRIIIRNQSATGRILISAAGVNLRETGVGATSARYVPVWGYVELFHNAVDEWVIIGTSSTS